MTALEERTVAAPGPAASLSGKVIIVTGASRGIGAATARRLAQAGAKVVLAARDAGALKSVTADIARHGANALAVPADVGDPGAVERSVNAARDRFGRLDGAFNNAGEGHMPAPLAKLAAEDFDRALRVNARGVFLCMKHEIPAMIDAGGGAIVNMSSTAGLAGVRGMGGYVAAKHAVIGLTKSAALDYAADGVRVNAVAPGPISSDRIAQLPDQARAQIARAVPLGHIGKPEDVAAAVTWLLSDEAAFITGATLTVDGGRLSGI